MNEEEFYQGLAKHDLDVAKACTAILLETGAILNPSKVRDYLSRNGRLSEPMTGLFRYFFMRLDNGRA